MIETYQAALFAQIEDLPAGDRVGVAERFLELVRAMAPPDPESALTFDEAEEAGVDGTLRDVTPGPTTYRVLMSQTAYYNVYVEADSEEEARAKVLDGDYDDSTFLEGDNDEVWDVEPA